MSELLGRASEFRRQIDAREARNQEQERSRQEQERLRAIQHEADVRQSQERVAEFLDLVRRHGAPTTDVMHRSHPGVNDTRSLFDETTYHKGWLVKGPRGGYDEPYYNGDFLQEDGTTYAWSAVSNHTSQELLWCNYGEIVYDDAYAGDEGLELLGKLLAKLGIS